MAAAAASAIAAAPSRQGSRGEMPNSIDVNVCATAREPARPIARPIETSTAASLSTSPTIWPRVAPNAGLHEVLADRPKVLRGASHRPTGLEPAHYIQPGVVATVNEAVSPE